ncbi:MAG: GAF domain-containing protein [Chloroflexi bacterium]|nr:GAF domain-containing protein [Chloroflexota bacterium]
MGGRTWTGGYHQRRLSDQRFFARVDRQSGFRTNSMVCIPLQVEERMIGVLQAINKKSGDFNEHDLRLLQAIGGPLAAAIENARLHSDVIAEKRRIETIINSMSEGLLTVNSDGLITRTNDALLTLLNAEDQALIGKPANTAIRLRSGSLEAFRQDVLAAEHEFPNWPQTFTSRTAKRLRYSSVERLCPTTAAR